MIKKISIGLLTLLISMSNVLSDTENIQHSFAKNAGLVGQQARNYNGAVAETFVTSYMKSNGYGTIDAEVGRNGLDGVFFKRINGKMEVTIIEVKHGLKAELGNSFCGKQMTNKCILNALNNKITALSKKPSLKDLATIRDLEEVKATVLTNKVKSRLMKIIPLPQEYAELNKQPSRTVAQQARFKELTQLKQQNKLKDSYKTTIDELIDGKKTDRVIRHNLNNTVISLNEFTTPGSPKRKQQDLLKHAENVQTKILAEKVELRKAVAQQKVVARNSKEYTALTKTIEKHHKKIKRIESSAPDLSNATKINNRQQVATETEAIIYKGKNKTIVFVEAKKLKHLALTHVKKGVVAMVVIDGGIAIYTILDGKFIHKKVAKLLVSGGKSASNIAFIQGLAYITPPPGTLFIVASIAGTVMIEYAIDKYIENNKRHYITLDDMLWDVPDEIRNKLTTLDIMNTEGNSVFVPERQNAESVFDEKIDNGTLFENNTENESTLEWME